MRYPFVPWPRFLSVGRVLVLLALLALLLGVTGNSSAQNLPAEVDAALARAKVPSDALAVLLVDAQGQSAPLVSHRAVAAMNPASVMKLVTTYAALDMLGPAFSWSTPVFADGVVRDGTLQGNLYIVGQGDPKLVLERLWLLLRRVQGVGIHTIAGDVVLDSSAFDVGRSDPSGFDGEPLKPYNAAPDALLVNFKALVMTFTPERGAGAGVARVQFDPPLAGVQMPTSVPLLAGACDDYRAALKADFSDPNRVRFMGGYPASCGEKVWPVAYADPASYASRAVQGLWGSMGGKLTGAVRSGRAPAGVFAGKPLFEVRSPSLAEIVRDINKYSNNVMAQQLFLTLGREGGAADTPDGPFSFVSARKRVQRWWQERISPHDLPVLDNGSGLSRIERISAQGLARLLQVAYASPLMPELMASLPISGVDGTLRRVQSRAAGSAHLKTGSLSDVVAVAGFVHAVSGRRFILVAIVNHPNAKAARPAIDTLVEWATNKH